MRPKWRLCLHLEATNVTPVFQEPRLYSNQRCVSITIKSRVSMITKSRISSTIERHISTIIESHISNSLKFASPLDQCDNRVYEGCVLLHARSMFMLLQSVQQYTGKSNRQLHQFNSTPTSKPELITSARLSF